MTLTIFNLRLVAHPPPSRSIFKQRVLGTFTAVALTRIEKMRTGSW